MAKCHDPHKRENVPLPENLRYLEMQRILQDCDDMSKIFYQRLNALCGVFIWTEKNS